MIRRILILALSVFFSTRLCAHADVIYVNIDATGSQTGQSWADAIADLAQAIAAAHSMDEIWIARGTYLATGTTNNSFSINSDIALYGGFAGSETSREQRDWKQNITTLSNSTGDRSVIKIDANATINGFTITGGRAPDGGGGIHVESNAPRIENCVIASNGGSGMYIAGGSPDIESCIFQNNGASFGGGLAIYGGSSVIKNCLFNSNYCAILGGAIYESAGSVTINFCTFTGNRTGTGGSGGAVAFEHSQIVTNSILWNDFGYQGSEIFMREGGQFSDCDVMNPGFGWYPVSPSLGVRIISSDPLFVDEANIIGGDGVWATVDDGLHLAYNSPCLNIARETTSTTHTLNTDIGGTIRSGNFNLGAYEYPKPPNAAKVWAFYH